MPEIELLTPLWTGDVDFKSDALRSCGVAGSLRWWTEAVLRALGEFACDPVSENSCPVGERKEYCYGCLLFGSTGWRRLFKLNLEGGTRVFEGPPINIKPLERKHGWHLGSGLTGKIKLDIIALDRCFDHTLVFLPLTIASWGGLGAKTQHGYGAFKLNQVSLPDVPKVERFQTFLKDFEKSKNVRKAISSKNISDENSSKSFGQSLPNIKDMFFCKLQFEATDDWWKSVDGIKERLGENSFFYKGYENDKRMKKWINSGSVPIAPALKSWFRYGSGRELWQLNNRNDKDNERFLFGVVKNGKQAAKVNFSSAYKIDDRLWEFRIWGWLPGNSLKEQFISNLYYILDASSQRASTGSLKIPWEKILGNPIKPRLAVWREFNSKRDTVKRCEKIEDFLQSLVDEGT